LRHNPIDGFLKEKFSQTGLEIFEAALYHPVYSPITLYPFVEMG
jgi:hypothetical protein